MDGNTSPATLKGVFACYLPRRAWFPITNIKANMWSPAIGQQEELYYADRATNRVNRISGFFSPSSSNRADADGTNVAPSATFRMIGDGPTLKHFGFGRLTYNMPGPSGDPPQLAVKFDPGIESPVFTTSAPESPLQKTAASGTDEVERHRFTVARVAQVMNVRVEQTGEADKTEIFALEAEVRPLNEQSEGQGTA
jgi:hypothetical protein